MNVSTLFRSLCIAACTLVSASAWAEPPGRVGRISFIEGTVSFYGDREDGWQKALLNYPVTSENSLWTEGNARAEVRIGPSAIRINDDSVLDIVNLQDDIAIGFLQRGSINVRLRQLGNLDASENLQIDTGEGRFMLDGNGRYRLDVMPGNNETRVSVFSGRARFESTNGEDTRLTIDAGKQLTVRISGTAIDFRYDAARESPFDHWADSRDQLWDQTHQRYARVETRDGVSDALISPYMTGYEDLDANGDWIDDNEYGRLWAPRLVVAGWAPYRYGRWTNVRPWGWTWIDDAPWGFAPFHYGRWVQVRSRWCWWPGPYVGRPVYAPALVAWFGSPGAGLRIASGPAVGWFPLAPREHFIPHYNTSPQYLRRINNVTNNITINPPNRYRNQVPGATIVPNQVFMNGNPVGNHRTHLPRNVIAGQGPIAAPDTPRLPRNTVTQMPDRRDDGQRGNLAPNPRFTNVPPPVQGPGQTRPVPGTPTPKIRAAEPSAGGPLPARRATPEPAPAIPGQSANGIHGFQGQGSAFPAPAVGVSPPSSTTSPPSPPRSRQQPTYVPPQTGATPSARPSRIEPAPVMTDREVRMPYSREQRPQPNVQSQPTPQIAVPTGVPRQSAPYPQSPPNKDVRDARPPAVKPSPEHVTKPRHEGPTEGGQAKN